MRYVDEYRRPEAAAAVIRRIRRLVTRRWTIMEICGGQTATIVRSGLTDLLPGALTLVHGPGCPVCVTPLEMIDRAIALARRTDVIFTSFGDMLRVPGSTTDLLALKAQGASVAMVYSPLDALAIAERNPGRRVVFFAVGFETTAPATAMAVAEAKRRSVRNFSILCAHVLVPPAIEAILSAPENRVQAFLAAGHVCTVMGTGEYVPLAARFRVPIVVTGFEPVDILRGIELAVKRLEEGRPVVENAYARAVRPGGNPAARSLMDRVFEPTDRAWRGIGPILRSGLRLKKDYAAFDAERLFEVTDIRTSESAECIAGSVLRGVRRPPECPEFGNRCTPEHPMGAPMVSSEGACAAYYHYRGASGEDVARAL